MDTLTLTQQVVPRHDDQHLEAVCASEDTPWQPGVVDTESCVAEQR